MSYTQVSAGSGHSVLLRSDGIAVAVGQNDEGQCNIPLLEDGMSYTDVLAGGLHTLLFRSDGQVVVCGRNDEGQCNIPSLEAGSCYIGGRKLLLESRALQLEFVHDGDSVTLVCTNLAGNEAIRVSTRRSDMALNACKLIAHELDVNIQDLELVLPDGQLLVAICLAHPHATVADVSEHGN